MTTMGSAMQARPDYNAMDTDKSGGMSMDELKGALSSGRFDKTGPVQGGPPPGGGMGGSAGVSQRDSVAATLLQEALDLSASEETADADAADEAVEALFAAMDADEDGSISVSEFDAFGQSVGGPPPGGGMGDQCGEAAATSTATALYVQYQSMSDITALAGTMTRLRL